MMCCYIKRFGLCFQFKKLMTRSFILVVFLLIYFFDIFQAIFADPLSSLARLFCAINMFLFMAYVYNLIIYSNDNRISAIQKISRPYIYFALYNVVIVILAAFLIGAGIISATDNEIAVNSITRVDVEAGQVYYFPKYISIVTSNSRLFSLQGIPMVTGLSHEPHVLNYFLIPSFFILLSINKFQKYKFLVYGVMFITLLFATSTTVLVCLGLMFVIDSIWSIIINRKLVNIIPMVLLVAVILYFGGTALELLQSEFIRKTVQDTDSMGYSQNILEYLLSPETLFGEGNAPRQFGYTMTTGNVGFVTFILDVSFFISILFCSLKLVFNRDSSIHYLGLASLYCILHTLKVPILFYSYPLYGFLLLINVYFNVNHKRYNNHINKNLAIS